MKQQLAVIRFLNPGDPDYPDQGLPGAGGHPDQGLPGYGHPSGQPIYPGGPTDPGFGGGRPQRPKPWPPTSPSFPPDATDPEWGVETHPHPSLPIFLPPGRVDNELPPVAGVKPPTTPPPGTIWPPLPPGLPTGKCAILIWISGVGHRYAVIDVPPTVDAGLPSGGAHPGHGLPETPQPKR